MAKDPVPIVPAAHYMCGGIRTGLDGETAIDRLLAAGEVASTGLHGANRLASNSLLEAVVFAERAAAHAGRLVGSGGSLPTPGEWIPAAARKPRESAVLFHNWTAIRSLMWDYVGIVRSEERLREAARRILVLREAVERYFRTYEVDATLLELRNLAIVASLIIASARLRKESRGLHYNLDYPERDDVRFGRDTILRGTEPARLEEILEAAGEPPDRPPGAGGRGL
jgi:L-aspartate oxidase